MCALCGIILEDHTADFPIGTMLYDMMESQQIRAQDSAGVAVYTGENGRNGLYKIGYFRKTTNGYEVHEEQVHPEDVAAHVRILEEDPHVLISSFSREMKVVKDVGLARDLDRLYDIRSMKGSHGTGHLRIATSSRVTPYNAHPFSTTAMPDVTVVHNGEITNYRRLRDSLELQGYRFHSDCDSEVIAVFIADQMLKHGDAEKAHSEFVKRADGPFTYIAATPHSVALVRDNSGTRKGIVGYNPGNDRHPAFWAMATDLSALDVVGATRRNTVETPEPGKPRIFYR